MVRVAYNSCRDRHCPKCQGLARAQWLADRQGELLPVAYFPVVSTMPAPIAAIALQNKAVVYDILFKAAAETVRTIAADAKHLGAETGMITVLHKSMGSISRVFDDTESGSSDKLRSRGNEAAQSARSSIKYTLSCATME